jgi:hypothetical protein
METRKLRVEEKKAMLEVVVKIFGENNNNKENLVILKGHLYLEESLNFIIENFVYHPDFLNKAKLSFSQKLNIARSMSLNEQANSMWMLIEKINTLRNDFSHRLESEKRKQIIQDIASLYKQIQGSEYENEWKDNDLPQSLMCVIGYCSGFLSGFEAEIINLKSMVSLMNKSLNRVMTKIQAEKSTSESHMDADEKMTQIL